MGNVFFKDEDFTDNQNIVDVKTEDGITKGISIIVECPKVVHDFEICLVREELERALSAIDREAEDPQCIPYTEEPEPEKSCDTCRQYQVGLCVVDSNCKENDYLYHTSIKKVEKEPKTKRVWDPDDSISELIHYPECWDTMAYPTLASALWEMCDLTGAICPTCKKPQGEPETVDQVLDDLFGMEDRHSLSKEIIDSFKSRIWKAAQERSEP